MIPVSEPWPNQSAAVKPARAPRSNSMPVEGGLTEPRRFAKIFMKMGSADFKLPWVAVSEHERERLEAELTREISLLHQLATTDRRVIARRVDTDDILIEISHLCECAEVHLTWSGKTEMSRDLPHTELQVTLEDWVKECMLPDHNEYLTRASV